LPNLNDLVDAICENKPSHLDMLNQLALVHDISIGESKKYIVRHKARQGKKRDEKKRKKSSRVRKNLLQKRVLEMEFGLNDVWDKEKISCISHMLGLSEGQIYKWQWDHQKKQVNSQFGK
jgi:hypothetical protein